MTFSRAKDIGPILQSIRLTLFSEKFTLPCVITVPILSYENLVQRVKDIAGRHSWISPGMEHQSFVDCRELFQERRSELFLFPSSNGTCVSLANMSAGDIFFLRHPFSWGFILCFHPSVTAGHHGARKPVTLFSEREGYPAGVSEASSFLLSHNRISILVSGHGHITTNSNDEPVLKGIEVMLLQKMRFFGKSIFVQRKNECVSPNRPLREGIGYANPIQRYKKYIKVRCICKAPGFCYSAQFPVLSEKELEEEVNKDHINRVRIYGSRSHFSLSEVLKYYLFEKPSTVRKHMIIFPYKMGIDVPFGDFEKGRMFFSYTDTTSSKYSSGNFKLTFFPNCCDPNKKIQGRMGKNMKKDFQKGSQARFSVCGTTKVSTFIPSGMNLVSFSSSEYKLDGATISMIATKNYGGWGVCLSRETISLSNSPIPGPSGLESRKLTTQATATVSVSPGQQTQQEGSKSPVPGGSGSSSYAYGSSFSAFPRATVAVSSKRQGQYTQQKGIRNPVPGPFGGRHHPYPYGPLPFFGGLYSYRSSITPYPEAAATVSVPPERQGQQTQQEGRSSPSGPSGIRHQVICPIPLRSQAASTAFVPFEQTQQRRSRSFPETFGSSFHSYPQHRPWLFAGGFHPYFYSETGSFVGGFDPHGSPCPPYPHPSARQDQWMPVLPSSASAVRSPVAFLEPLRYDIPAQEGVGQSGRAEVPVGTVQQAPIWRPYETGSSVIVPPQAQAENSSEKTD